MKERVYKDVIELNVDDNGIGEYVVKAIYNNAIYIRELVSYLPELYYLVSWKGYLKKENI